MSNPEILAASFSSHSKPYSHLIIRLVYMFRMTKTPILVLQMTYIQGVWRVGLRFWFYVSLQSRTSKFWLIVTFSEGVSSRSIIVENFFKYYSTYFLWAMSNFYAFLIVSKCEWDLVCIIEFYNINVSYVVVSLNIL